MQAGMNFLEACRRIARAEKENRFGRLLRTLFSESKVPALLADDGDVQPQRDQANRNAADPLLNPD
jgi:hypothetical protein